MRILTDEEAAAVARSMWEVGHNIPHIAAEVSRTRQWVEKSLRLNEALENLARYKEGRI